HALATHVVAGLGDTHLAIRVMLDEDHSFGPDLLVLDKLYKSLEVLLSRLEALIASHDDIERIFHRVLTFFVKFRMCPAKYRITLWVGAKNILPRLPFIAISIVSR